MKPIDYEILGFFLIHIFLGVGGLFLILGLSFKRRAMSYWNLLNPFSIFELQLTDYLRLAAHFAIMIFLLRNGYIQYASFSLGQWLMSILS